MPFTMKAQDTKNVHFLLYKSATVDLGKKKKQKLNSTFHAKELFVE